MRRSSPAGEDVPDYAIPTLTLHDEALRNLTMTDLAGRVLLGLTQDATRSNARRIVARFRRNGV